MHGRQNFDDIFDTTLNFGDKELILHCDASDAMICTLVTRSRAEIRMNLFTFMLNLATSNTNGAFQIKKKHRKIESR